VQSASDRPVLLIALGGNALVKKGQTGTADEQFENLQVPMAQIAELSRSHRIIITHGNGPQVGNLMLQQECCREEVPRLPLEILVAQTQGQIGYMIESTLDNQLMAIDVHDQRLVSLLSYVVVDESDPAFKKPTKPIGPVYSEAQARALPYPVVQTSRGWRRVVVSPRPVTIVEKREIQDLMRMGFIVICCGGGGIPVIREGRTFCGVDAVIDKDLASARLAEEVGVDIFLIATDEAGAIVDYGTDAQKVLGEVGAGELRALAAAGHFPPGSMGPKVEAALQFVENSGRRAAICALADIAAAAAGRAGTQIRLR